VLEMMCRGLVILLIQLVKASPVRGFGTSLAVE